MNRGIQTLSLALATFIATGAVPVFADSGQYNILPVGDSITVGYTDNPNWTVPFNYGYRSGLYTSMTNAGFSFQYVGNSPEPFNGVSGNPTAPPAPNLDTLGQDHSEGYGGVGTSFVNTNMSTWLSVDKPSIILLMIGINDIGAGSSAAPTGAEANLNSIVNTVVNDAPNAHLIVAQITPYTISTPAIVQYNSYISTTLVPQYESEGKNVTTVNQYANFVNPDGSTNTSLYANGFNHPNAAGYALMAQTWFAGIQALNLPPLPPAPKNLVTNGSFEAPQFANGTHNINPSGAGWNFTTSSIAGAGTGIDHGDPYGAGNSSAADGVQQAFLQSSGDSSVSSISQVVSGFTPGTKYTLTFESKAIQGFQGADPFQVTMSDGITTIPLFSGDDITPVVSQYTTYSDTFTATSSTMTLDFFDHGLSTYQEVSWIDAVSITAVPEPATGGLLTLGGLLLARRRRKFGRR